MTITHEAERWIAAQQFAAFGICEHPEHVDRMLDLRHQPCPHPRVGHEPNRVQVVVPELATGGNEASLLALTGIEAIHHRAQHVPHGYREACELPADNALRQVGEKRIM